GTRHAVSGLFLARLEVYAAELRCGGAVYRVSAATRAAVSDLACGGVGLLKVLLAFSLLLAVTGCSTWRTGGVDGAESGVASYYADQLQGRKTASGERYRHDALTAAHRTLPFGTQIKVTNLANGKSVVVRINDRGPFVRGRVIDLSKSAFGRIGSLSSGLLNVQLRVVSSAPRR
ncbi:MAG: septal ring lytic transglycosylase RlpA family protein, partial [Pseudomonadaceae bacterium]